MADLDFQIAARPEGQPITFTLGDEHEYVFTPPKQAVMLLSVLDAAGSDDEGEQGMAYARAMFDWLGEGLSTEDNDRILARLRDRNDGLDIENLGDVVKGLMEHVSGRPTT